MKMELSTSFWAGLGCGLCLGISVYAFRRLFSKDPQSVNPGIPTKQFTAETEYKVILVVRSDLNMTKGKIAAQCGHASVGVFEKAQTRDPKALEQWLLGGQTKVAVKTDSLEEIINIATNAKKLGLITSLIRDAGRTQIAPNSVTVLGIGPAPKLVLDKITGHLKLL